MKKQGCHLIIIELRRLVQEDHPILTAFRVVLTVLAKGTMIARYKDNNPHSLQEVNNKVVRGDATITSNHTLNQKTGSSIMQ
jgi:hypothetical protein